MRSRILALILSLFICSTAWAGIDFDRVDDYINVGTMGSFGDGLDNNYLVLSTWVKSSNTTNLMCITGTFNTGTVTGFQFYLNTVDGSTLGAGKIYAFRRSESGQTRSGGVNSDTGITNGKWHHLLIAHGPSTINIWVDGVSQSITYAISGTANAIANFGFPLIYGARNNRGTIDAFFSGTLSDIAIGSSVNLPSDVDAQNLASRVKRMPLQYPTVFNGFYHPLDDQPDGTSFDGDTANDLSGTGNPGTGVDGANNTGLTVRAEEALSYL